MKLKDFVDRYGSLRLAANALRKPHTTLNGWLKSEVVREIRLDEKGEPKVWRRE